MNEKDNDAAFSVGLMGSKIHLVLHDLEKDETIRYSMNEQEAVQLSMMLSAALDALRLPGVAEGRRGNDFAPTKHYEPPHL